MTTSFAGNRVTALLGIDVPVIQGGMVYNSGAKLAAAVSNAGGLGLVGAGSMRPDLFRDQLRKARTLTDPAKAARAARDALAKHGSRLALACAEDGLPFSAWTTGTDWRSVVVGHLGGLTHV